MKIKKQTRHSGQGEIICLLLYEVTIKYVKACGCKSKKGNKHWCKALQHILILAKHKHASVLLSFLLSTFNHWFVKNRQIFWLIFKLWIQTLSHTENKVLHLFSVLVILAVPLHGPHKHRKARTHTHTDFLSLFVSLIVEFRYVFLLCSNKVYTIVLIPVST